MPRGTRASAIDLISWSIVAVVGAVALTQAVGWTRTAVLAVAQALTPYLAIVLVPVTIVALVRRRLLVVTVASAVLFGMVVLAAPLAVPDPQPPAAADAAGLRVASLNLWNENTEIDAVAPILDALELDMIVFSEYSLEHQHALEASPLARTFPHRIEQYRRDANGVGIWSRFPIDGQKQEIDFTDRLDVEVRGPDGDLRIVGVHIPAPSADFATWRSELSRVADIGRRTDDPTLLIGDLNTSYWHPDFRRLLDAGFVDAHTAAGAGFSTSWPTDWWIPPFVRLDHALTAGGLVSTDVEDFDIPGSDHRGLVVTVAPTR